MSEYIYAIRNPSSPGHVKVGRTKDWKRRIRQHSASVHEDPEIVDLISVKNAAGVEKRFKTVFRDRRVPEKREWFELQGDQVRAFLDLCGDRIDSDSGVVAGASGAGKGTRKRRPNFTFSMLGIKVGTELCHLFDPQTKCVVSSNSKVEFEGETMTLSKAGQIVCERLGINWTSYGGPHLWTFKKEVLSHIRRRKDESG